MGKYYTSLFFLDEMTALVPRAQAKQQRTLY